MKKAMSSVYRAIRLGERIPTAQGSFSGISDIQQYMIKYRLRGVFRLERVHNGKWIFVQNFAIAD